MLFRPLLPPISSSAEVQRGENPGNMGLIFYRRHWESVISRVLNVLKYIIMGGVGGELVVWRCCNFYLSMIHHNVNLSELSHLNKYDRSSWCPIQYLVSQSPDMSLCLTLFIEQKTFITVQFVAVRRQKYFRPFLASSRQNCSENLLAGSSLPFLPLNGTSTVGFKERKIPTGSQP